MDIRAPRLPAVEVIDMTPIAPYHLTVRLQMENALIGVLVLCALALYALSCWGAL